MRESGYYPPGAEFDPNAPYNQCDPPEIDIAVTVHETLVKEDSVVTNDAWYVYEEEGGCYLEDTNFHPCEEWKNQNDLLAVTIFKAKEEITKLRIEAEERQLKIEAHYGIRHNTVPGYSNPTEYEKTRRQIISDAISRVRYLKALEAALTGWEHEEIDVEH